MIAPPNSDKKTLKLWKEYCAQLQASKDEINDEIRQSYREEDEEDEKKLAAYKSRSFLYRFFHRRPISSWKTPDYFHMSLAYFEPTFEGFYTWLAERKEEV